MRVVMAAFLCAGNVVMYELNALTAQLVDQAQDAGGDGGLSVCL